MTIHHTHIKKAEKLGIQLSEEGDIGLVRAFWPKRALVIYGVSSSDALTQSQAAIALLDGNDYRMETDIAESRLVNVYLNDDKAELLQGCPMPPVAAHKAIVLDKNPTWVQIDGEDLPDVDLTSFKQEDAGVPFGEADTAQSVTKTDTTTASSKTIERINGVATQGDVAYAEGTASADCPYSSEDDDDEYGDFVRWNDEWDAAADAAEEEKENKGGSVVAEKYRAKYIELGHPTHCGDWLANLLNNLCLTKKDTDLGRFEAICQANGVNTDVYKRDGVGWQGRIRMTGRNLLAKKVYLAGGVIKTPVEGAEPEYRAPADWMTAQRFKMPKAEQTAPIPAPVAAA